MLSLKLSCMLIYSLESPEAATGLRDFSESSELIKEL